MIGHDVYVASIDCDPDHGDTMPLSVHTTWNGAIAACVTDMMENHKHVCVIDAWEYEHSATRPLWSYSIPDDGPMYVIRTMTVQP